jgi:putative transposase
MYAASTASAAPLSTFYNWNAEYGRIEVSDARRLRALWDENAKLKKLLAEAMLDNDMLREVCSSCLSRSTTAEKRLQIRRHGGRKRALGTGASLALPQGPTSSGRWIPWMISWQAVSHPRHRVAASSQSGSNGQPTLLIPG